MSKHHSAKLGLLILLLSLSQVPLVLAQDIAGGVPARPTPRKTFKVLLEVTANSEKVEGARVLLESGEQGVNFSRETRTNRQGVASASSVPSGKLRVQVIAKDCDTFGNIVTISQDNQSIRVELTKRTPSPSPSP